MKNKILILTSLVAAMTLTGCRNFSSPDGVVKTMLYSVHRHDFYTFEETFAYKANISVNGRYLTMNSGYHALANCLNTLDSRLWYIFQVAGHGNGTRHYQAQLGRKPQVPGPYGCSFDANIVCKPDKKKRGWRRDRCQITDLHMFDPN